MSLCHPATLPAMINDPAKLEERRRRLAESAERMPERWQRLTSPHRLGTHAAPRDLYSLTRTL